jgi:hypothetical protein
MSAPRGTAARRTTAPGGPDTVRTPAPPPFSAARARARAGAVPTERRVRP